MINFVDGRERVNSKDNFDGNPSVKAAEFSEVYIDLIKLDNKHKSKHYNITIHIYLLTVFPCHCKQFK